MKLAVWLDGVIFKASLTERLYKIYKEGSFELPTLGNSETYGDYLVLKEYEKDMAILSPFSKEETERLLKKVQLKPSILVYNKGKTKPSLIPYKELFEVSEWDPLEVVTIGASPLDLLSCRFYDSRVRIICVNRGEECDKYSPTFMIDDLNELGRALRTLKVT